MRQGFHTPQSEQKVSAVAIAALILDDSRQADGPLSPSRSQELGEVLMHTGSC